MNATKGEVDRRIRQSQSRGRPFTEGSQHVHEFGCLPSVFSVVVAEEGYYREVQRQQQRAHMRCACATVRALARSILGGHVMYAATMSEVYCLLCVAKQCAQRGVLAGTATQTTAMVHPHSRYALRPSLEATTGALSLVCAHQVRYGSSGSRKCVDLV